MKLTDINIQRQEFIYAAIHLLSNRLQIIGNKLDPTISEKQWFVLAAVSKHTTPPSLSDIANALGTSRQNIKKIASTLEKHGFLRMEKDKNDLRIIRLFLTEKCIIHLKSREPKEDEYLSHIFTGIDETTLDILCSGMTKLMENIDNIVSSFDND